VDGAEIARDVRRRILATAEGNPLYVEELFAMMAGDGLITRDEDRWVATRALSTVPIPPTVLALLSARLDRLPPAPRRVLEHAAVVGLEFSREDLLAFDEGGAEVLDPILDRLVAADLVVVDDRTPRGGRPLRFRHILLRDSVYAAIPKETRATDHALFALDLELRAGPRLAEVEEILGYHLEMAWRYRSELGLEVDPALGERAAVLLWSAGRRAFHRTDNSGAVGLLGRAAALLPADDPRRLEIDLLLGIVAFDEGRVDDAQELLAQGLAAAELAGNERIAWRLRIEAADIETWLSSDGQVRERMETLGRQAIDALEPLGDLAGLARAHRLLGDAHVWRGRWEEGAAAYVEGRRLAIEAGDEREAAERPSQGVAFGPIPVATAVGMAEASVEATRRRNPDGISSLGLILAMAGRREEGLALMDEATERATELGEWRAASVRMYHAFGLLVLDEPETAERVIRPAVEALVRMGERNLMPSAAILLAEALYRQGRLDEAMLATMMSEQVTGKDDVAARVGWRSTRGKVLAAQGDLGEAERVAREAVQIGSGTGFLPFEADSLADLGAVLEAAGKTSDAISALRSALEVYERKGIVPSAARTRATLARLESG
jgi:tetratricopeptide (TPR) repeat protein